MSKVVERDGTPVVDRQGDIIPVDELEAAAKAFMLDSRAADVMHDTQAVGKVFESYVSTPEKRAAQGYGDPTDQTVGWWVGMEVPQDVFKRVQSGELRAFSIGGAAVREDVTKAKAVKRLVHAIRENLSALTRFTDEAA